MNHLYMTWDLTLGPKTFYPIVALTFFFATTCILKFNPMDNLSLNKVFEDPTKP